MDFREKSRRCCSKLEISQRHAAHLAHKIAHKKSEGKFNLMFTFKKTELSLQCMRRGWTESFPRQHCPDMYDTCHLKHLATATLQHIYHKTFQSHKTHNY